MMITVAAGIGWLLYRASQSSIHSYSGIGRSDEDDVIPVLNTGHVRVYDPDTSSRHPTHDTLETRRDVSARA